MKVLMVNRSDALTNFGGDTNQMINTQLELNNLGIEVELALGPQKIETYEKFDIIHLFNIQTQSFSYNEALKIKKCKRYLILSPIYWDFLDDY